VVRSFVILFLGAAFVAPLSGQHGIIDPAFEKIPFNRWLEERVQASFRLTVRVPRAELSFHQRLMARVEIALDGRDLKTRRGDGQLVFFVQITDGDGNRYQDHGSIELSKLDENIEAANLEYSQPAFFLPGDYRLAIAILDTATGDHSTRQTQFRVTSPQHDVLPDAWGALQPVEFIGKEESPDGWYLPEIQGRLRWAARVQSPARLTVILNVATSVPVPGSRRAPSGEMEALLPTLKALSQTGSTSVSEHVELLDLARRRTVFNQDEVHDLDWPRVKASLGDAKTTSIDIHSLSERHHDAQFFVSRVRSVLHALETPCVLVVLTKPLAFESGEDLEAISLEGIPACRVFYIRYRPPVQLTRPSIPQMGGPSLGSRRRGPMTRDQFPKNAVDQLAATLKPLSPKVVDIGTPEQMAKVLAEIEKALLTPGGQPSR
jgi:hypothetical protein